MARDYGFAAAQSDAIKQHQMIARGGSPMAGDSFGCAPLSSTDKPGAHMQGTSAANRTLQDSARNAPVAHSRGMGQANPDHGKLY